MIGPVEIVKKFTSDQYARALESWTWLPLSGKTPVLSSAFGDVILADGSGYWFLYTIEGALTQPWHSEEELRTSLNTPEGQDRYLLGGLAVAANKAGLQCNDGEVLSFKVPPILGGAIEVANLDVLDFVVSTNLASQLHQQVKDFPPGTTISGFNITD